MAENIPLVQPTAMTSLFAQSSVQHAVCLSSMRKRGSGRLTSKPRYERLNKQIRYIT